jgi:hypothetical protein
MTDFRQLLDDLETAAWRAMTAASRNGEECAPQLSDMFNRIEAMINEYEEGLDK